MQHPTRHRALELLQLLFFQPPVLPFLPVRADPSACDIEVVQVLFQDFHLQPLLQVQSVSIFRTPSAQKVKRLLFFGLTLLQLYFLW